VRNPSGLWSYDPAAQVELDANGNPQAGATRRDRVLDFHRGSLARLLLQQRTILECSAEDYSVAPQCRYGRRLGAEDLALSCDCEDIALATSL
jgi:hypothetical protein